MTRQEFVEKHRHYFGGLVLDAVTMGLHGPQASVWLRTVMRNIDLALAAAYDDATADNQPLPIKGAQLRKAGS